MRKKWSDEDIKTLKSMYSEKKTITEISIALGRTKKSVINHAHVLGISKKREKQREEIYDYAIYKGDEFIFVGTIEECREFTGMGKNQIKVICSRSHIERVNAIVNGKALVGVRLPR